MKQNHIFIKKYIKIINQKYIECLKDSFEYMNK